MPWKTFKGRKKEYKPKASELFLKRCRVLIALWLLILLLMVGLAVLVDLSGGSSKTWAQGLFVAACVLDVLVTCKILPGVFKILKDEVAKESFVRRKIWKLRFLLFTNLFFSLSFVA